MSNTLDLLETNDFPTAGISTDFITLIDSRTKELVNFVKIASGPTVDGVMYLKENVHNYVYERVYNGVINPEWFGPGKTDLELQTAINKAKKNDTILIRDEYRCSHQIIIDKDLTFVGQNYINGNDVGGNTNSSIYFVDFEDTTADSCINANNNNINFKNLVVTGSNIAGKVGIKVTNGAVVLDSVTVQNFETGIEVTQGYYNKFINSAIVYCPVCLVLNNCYNANAISLLINAGYESGDGNTKGIVLTDGTNLTVFGGSIERFSEAGVELFASRVSCFGTYFEGVYDEENINTCFKVQSNSSRVTTVGCHVYLKFGCANIFIDIPSNVSSAHIYSKNNYFEYEEIEDWYTSVYRLATTDFSNYNIDISGDNYKNDIINTGSSYISITSALLKKGSGIINIIYPSGHPLAGVNLTNLNTASPYQYNDPIGAQNGMITTFANAGYPGDDGAGIQGIIGYVPYTAVCENGSWEKIPKL
jgi:hypothetical protein